MKTKNKHWFTLVELIIVIIILSILSTIAYASYSWIIWEARNTKRISDLSEIEKSIELNVGMKWISFISFVKDNANTLSNTGWQLWEYSWLDWYSWSEININKYKAWRILEELIWWQNFKDPLWESYRIWVYKNRYELATTLEKSHKPYQSYIIWNYKSRKWSVSGNSENTNIFTLDSQFINYFNVWDRVFTYDEDSNWGYKIIKSISKNWTNLTLDSETDSSSLSFSPDEVDHLISEPRNQYPINLDLYNEDDWYINTPYIY